MTKKKQARKLGKEIRAITGVKLPIAMRVARLLIRGRRWDIPPEWLTPIPFFCGFGCCGTKLCREKEREMYER